jgi:hypothetical protein
MALDKSKFQKPAAKSANGAAAAGGGRPKSRWAGMRSAKPRDPMPHVGIYRLRITEIEKRYGNAGNGNRESVVTAFAIVDLDEKGSEAHAAGDVVKMINLYTSAGMAEFQAFVNAAGGFESDDDYVAALGDDGGFVAGILGEGSGPAQATLVGRLVDVEVGRGKDDGKGDYYRRYAFAVVGEDEQDETPSIVTQLKA